MTPIERLVTDFGRGVSAIDTEYVRPRMDASHLIVHGGRAAFVDTGANNAVPNLLAALAQKGLSPEQVDYIFVTHVHLDHAGGAGLLLRSLPNATVVVHPRGLRHLADPSKLIAGTIAVYGEDGYRALYGDLEPIPEARLRAAQDGECYTLSGRPLYTLHTPGHALHHYCLHDPEGGGVFTGDTFGISYRETDSAQGPFIFPTTTPVQFDPAALHASIDRLVALQPEAMYLTHYSRVSPVPALGAALKRRLDALVAIAVAHKDAQGRTAKMEEAVLDWLCKELDAHGDTQTFAQRRDVLWGDVALNVQGLEVWLDKSAAQKVSHT
jgi:glyoxylase-like metal-dependent hydrolase (beta-lactamase superfamily II)